MMTAVELEQTVLRLKEYRAEYRDYWQTTVNLTDTGKSHARVLKRVLSHAK